MSTNKAFVSSGKMVPVILVGVTDTTDLSSLN